MLRGRSWSLLLCSVVGALQLPSPSKPFCIGVAGASASGKSSVVAEIVNLLDHDSVASITQDCFYRSLSPEEHEQAYQQNYNFDHPSAFDQEHQLKVMSELKAGVNNVAIPSYDFVTHSRQPSEHNTVVRSPTIVIFEGIFGLYDKRMRDLFDLQIFVDADADVRLARRIRRDMQHRGRDLSGILQQYEQFVKPATETFVLPQKAFADIIIPRGAENTVAIELVAQHINGVLVHRELELEAAVQEKLGTLSMSGAPATSLS